MITEEEKQILLNQSPAPRVTKEAMEGRLAECTFTRLSPTMTVCMLTLDNGYTVIGQSACVNPENYQQAIGEKIAYEAAIAKLWPLFGFLLAEDQFRGKDQGE